MGFKANICHFFLCFHRCPRFYCYFLSANSALGKEAARKRAAKESDIIFAAQFAAHSRKAEYRPAAIPLPQGEYSKKHGKSRAFFTNRARQSPAHAFSFFTITYYFQGRKGVFGEEIKIKAPKTCAFGTLWLHDKIAQNIKSHFIRLDLS